MDFLYSILVYMIPFMSTILFYLSNKKILVKINITYWISYFIFQFLCIAGYVDETIGGITLRVMIAVNIILFFYSLFLYLIIERKTPR